LGLLLDRKIWAIASGKGGTGKTVVAVSMAAHLADLGFRVALVDVDLGCANLHTCLDIERPKSTLFDFIDRRIEHIEEVAVDTSIPRLKLISGALDPIEAAHIRYQQKRRVIRQLNTMEADVVILDLATGASLTEVELFCASDLGALVVLPEPTAVENAYRLLRMLYFQRVREIQGYKKIVKKLPGPMKNGSMPPIEFIRRLFELEPEWADSVSKKMENFTPGIIVNQVKAKEDRELGPGIKLVGKRYFALDMPYLGSIEYDDCVWQAVRHKKPVIIDYPHSRPSRSIRQVTEAMLSISRRPT
jgi:flagellar biosynthesis protein FlhG